MSDNDDYMVAKATDDTITELMWDRLQEGINANRRFRLKGIAGGNNMRYSSTKVVWDSDIYVYFTRESDGAWVYNKINANPTTGVVCGNDDVLYVTLNDTTATVLTVTAADYTSMPTDDTGRILILGAVRDSRWYGISSTDISHDSILNVSIDDHHARSHDNTYHSTNYEAANANIQNHVGSPPADSHHTKYALTDDLSSQEITQLQTIGESTTIIAGQWGYLGALTESPQTHMSAANPHSASLNTSHAGGNQHIDWTQSGAGTIHTNNYIEYSDTLVESVITAELVEGQSIDNAIDSLIGTHVLITGAHHPQSHTHDSHTGTLTYLEGGTGQSTYVKGDLLWASAANVLSRLGVSGASQGDVLTIGASSVLGWEPSGTPGAHDIDGASHTLSGSAQYKVLAADSGTAFSFQDLVYSHIDQIVDTSGGGATNLISRADHVHTAADGSSKITYSNLLSIPSTFAPSEHDNTAHNPDYATASDLTTHTSAANPHSGSAPSAGSSSIVTVGALSSGSITSGFSTISTAYTSAKCTATWPNSYSANQNLGTGNSPTFAGLSVGDIALGASCINVNDGNNHFLKVGGHTNRWGIRIDGTSNYIYIMGYSRVQFTVYDSTIGYFDTVSLRVNTIKSMSDEHHRISMYGASDSMYLYPGNDAGDYYLVLKSTSAGGLNPLVLPSHGGSAGSGSGRVGNSSQAWSRMYADSMYDDDGILSSFDEHDDLAIIDNFELKRDSQTQEIMRDEHNNPYVTRESIPDFLKNTEEADEVNPTKKGELSFVRPSQMAMFGFGAIKQLHRKVKEQQIIIEQLAAEVAILKGI